VHRAAFGRVHGNRLSDCGSMFWSKLNDIMTIIVTKVCSVRIYIIHKSARGLDL